MAVHPIVVKAIVKAATDKRTWKLIAIMIAAFLMPMIVVTMMVASLFAGTQDANRNLLDYSFKNKFIPLNFTAEQRKAINDMRGWLGELEDAIDDFDGSLDEELVKAVFYCLQFASELQTDDDEDFDYEKFCECFDDLSYEEFAEITENLRDEFPQYEITYNLSYAVGKVYEYLTQ